MSKMVLSITSGNLASSVTMGSVTFNFSEPVVCGLDQTLRAFVVDNGSGVTVTNITPAQTVDGSGDVINGAEKNMTVAGSGQGLDGRFSHYDPARNVTGTISLSAGDKLIKAVIDNTAVLGDRDGMFSEFACLHCVTTAPTATQVLGPSLTWAGDATPEVYDFDLDAFYAARATQSAANIDWSSYPDTRSQVSQYWPTYCVISGASPSEGYENFSPRGFGRDATSTHANYGSYISSNISDMMLATTIPAGGVLTEGEIKQDILTILMHGIEWGIPGTFSSFSLVPDGGHHQFIQGPSIFALSSLGLGGNISSFMEKAGGNLRQTFKISDLSEFADHTTQYGVWFRRERTLSTQPGGSDVTLPFKVVSGYGANGWDMQRDARMASGTRVVRSDGQVVTINTDFRVPDPEFSGQDPVFSTLPLTAANTLQSGDVVTLLPPLDSPVQLGSYDWTLRAADGGTGLNNFSPAISGYQGLQRWGGQVMALLAHGITDASLESAIGYLEWANLPSTPSATVDYPAVTSGVADAYFSENWDTSWSVITVPSAFVLANWTLDAGGNVSISALPDNGGALITSIEYRLNGGTWTATTGISEYSVIAGATVDFTIPAYSGQTVELRAVNDIRGAGAESDVKSA